MLTIYTNEGQGFNWKIKQVKPYVGLDHISHIKADGSELEHVISLFTRTITIVAPGDEVGNVLYCSLFPTTNKGVCFWTGDVARAIYLNIGNEETK